MAKLERHHSINGRLLVSLALLLCSVMPLYSYFGNVAAQTQTTTCTGIHGPYVLEGNDGGLYAIVGIPSNLQVGNHTTATISGTLVPSTPAQTRISPAFRGDIFATQWLINGITYSFAQTYTIGEGTQTTVTTLTNQVVSPTTISKTVVLAPVTVTGYLDYLSESCFAPGQSSSATSTIQSNSLLLWALLIVVVVAIALIAVVLLVRRQRRTAPPLPSSAQPAIERPNLGSSEMMLCPSCGAPVKTGAYFCEVCGKRLA
jgi:hypothetical protein